MSYIVSTYSSKKYEVKEMTPQKFIADENQLVRRLAMEDEDEVMT